MDHLRVRAHGETLTLESGPAEDPVRHARFKRDTVHLWLLEVASHTGRWDPTPLRAPLLDLADVLVQQFGWVLEPVGGPWEPGSDLGS